MVFQADISILYSTRIRTETDEPLVSCKGAADTNESTSEVAVATRRQYLPDKIRINHDTPTLAPGLGTDFENESAFCL